MQELAEKTTTRARFLKQLGDAGGRGRRRSARLRRARRPHCRPLLPELRQVPGGKLPSGHVPDALQLRRYRRVVLSLQRVQGAGFVQLQERSVLAEERLA